MSHPPPPQAPLNKAMASRSGALADPHLCPIAQHLWGTEPPPQHSSCDPTFNGGLGVEATPTYGAAIPTYGAAAPTLGVSTPTYGAATPTYGAAPPSFLPPRRISGGTAFIRANLCDIKGGGSLIELGVSAPPPSHSCAPQVPSPRSDVVGQPGGVAVFAVAALPAVAPHLKWGPAVGGGLRRDPRLQLGGRGAVGLNGGFGFGAPPFAFGARYGAGGLGGGQGAAPQVGKWGNGGGDVEGAQLLC